MPRGDWGDTFANAYTASLERVSGLLARKNEFDQTMKMEQQKVQREQDAKDAFMSFIGGVKGQGVDISGVGSASGVNIGMPGSNSPYIIKPDMSSKMGFSFDSNPAYKAEISAQGKRKAATEKATGNFGRVAGAMKQYADYYAQALDEGGAGGLIAREKGKLVTQHLGGSAGEGMVGTGKLFGQRAELSLSMVPILTNQNRFMTSIMDYINQSLPQGHEGAKMAAGKFEQTLLNSFVTTKILSRLGYDPDISEEVAKLDEMDDKEAGGLATKVISLSKSYELNESEQKEFNRIKKDVLGSLTDYKPKGKQSEKRTIKLPSGKSIEIGG